MSIRLNHLSPLTPSSRAVSMRSVQTEGSVQAHRARTSPACLALMLPDTLAGLSSFGFCFTHPPSCAAFAPRPLQAVHRYYARSDSCMGLRPHAGLPGSRTRPLPSFRLQPLHVLLPSLWHVTHQRDRLPRISAGSDFAIHSQARQDIRPNRVRYPTDRQFISCCFPPRLAATQLHSITGRRTHAWGGLTPP